MGMGDSLWTYAVLAVVTTLPLIPNSAVLAAAGALAAAGELNLVSVAASSLCGAAAGGLAVFAVGRRTSDRLLGRLCQWQKAAHRLVHSMQRYGTAAVIGVRFVPGGRFASALSAAGASFTPRRYLWMRAWPSASS